MKTGRDWRERRLGRLALLNLSVTPRFVLNLSVTPRLLSGFILCELYEF